MTDRACLEAAWEAIDKMLDSGAQKVGGYPGFCDSVSGWTLIVDVSEGEPRLKKYRNRTVVRWYREALRFLRDCPEEDMETALGETWPDQDR